jgi:hypothetical protein
VLEIPCIRTIHASGLVELWSAVDDGLPSTCVFLCSVLLGSVIIVVGGDWGVMHLAIANILAIILSIIISVVKRGRSGGGLDIGTDRSLTLTLLTLTTRSCSHPPHCLLTQSVPRQATCCHTPHTMHTQHTTHGTRHTTDGHTTRS